MMYQLSQISHSRLAPGKSMRLSSTRIKLWCLVILGTFLCATAPKALAVDFEIKAARLSRTSANYSTDAKGINLFMGGRLLLPQPSLFGSTKGSWAYQVDGSFSYDSVNNLKPFPFTVELGLRYFLEPLTTEPNLTPYFFTSLAYVQSQHASVCAQGATEDIDTSTCKYYRVSLDSAFGLHLEVHPAFYVFFEALVVQMPLWSQTIYPENKKTTTLGLDVRARKKFSSISVVGAGFKF